MTWACRMIFHSCLEAILIFGGIFWENCDFGENGEVWENSEFVMFEKIMHLWSLRKWWIFGENSEYWENEWAWRMIFHSWFCSFFRHHSQNHYTFWSSLNSSILYPDFNGNHHYETHLYLSFFNNLTSQWILYQYNSYNLQFCLYSNHGFNSTWIWRNHLSGFFSLFFLI